MTGVSFAMCKKALEETNNNIEAAKKKLEEWSGEKLSEKSARTTSEGGIFCYVHHNRKIAAMIELLTETDFVAGNEEFKTLGQEIAMQAATNAAPDVKSFVAQEYIRDPSKKIEDLIKEAVLKFGENIKVSRIVRFALGESSAV